MKMRWISLAILQFIPEIEEFMKESWNSHETKSRLARTNFRKKYWKNSWTKKLKDWKKMQIFNAKKCELFKVESSLQSWTGRCWCPDRCQVGCPSTTDESWEWEMQWWWCSRRLQNRSAMQNGRNVKLSAVVRTGQSTTRLEKCLGGIL